MSTKEVLEDFASASIFECLSNPMMSDFKPLPLFLPSRKFIPTQGYYAEIEPFTGTPEVIYSYLYNLKSMPKMHSFYTSNQYYRDSHVVTLKDYQRHDIVRNSVFYFGHVTFNFNKVCSLFMEHKYDAILEIFKAYFKKGFKVEDLSDHFPNFPECALLGRTSWDLAGSPGAFATKVQRDVEDRASRGVRRRLHADLKFSKCIGITEYEHRAIRDQFPDILAKVSKYLLMIGYALHVTEQLPEGARFYRGFIREESEQYHRPQEAMTCSSSLTEHRSDQQ
jgi:hypothetical protein